MRIDIEVLRVICVIIVVLFHTVSRYEHPELTVQLPERFIHIITSAIWFAVPMFLFISGFLFNIQIKKNRYSSWLEMAKQKALHLLLPYVVFTTMIMLSSGSFEINQILRGGFWHLWFLPTLFCCFAIYYHIFTYVSRCYSPVYEWGLLLITFILSFIRIPTEFCFAGIDGALKWGFYFTLGFLIGMNEKNFKLNIKKYKLWLPLLAIWTLNFLFFHTPYMRVSLCITIAITAILIVAIYFVADIRVNPRIADTIYLISSASMGIYIFHYWILVYATSTTSFRLLGCFENASQNFAIWMIVSITICVIICSLVVTKLMKSCKYFKQLI